MIEYYFALATGWLGWSPSETWKATIPQIELAYEAFCEKSRWLNGERIPTPAEKAIARDKARMAPVRQKVTGAIRSFFGRFRKTHPDRVRG